MIIIMSENKYITIKHQKVQDFKKNECASSLYINHYNHKLYKSIRHCMNNIENFRIIKYFTTTKKKKRRRSSFIIFI